MKATDFEFKNRALLIGLTFAVSFPLYAIDPQNVTAALATRLAPLLRANDDHLARVLFILAALIVTEAAFIRTWASAYLRSDVVYAANVKTAALVADGPYRRVRNPLYLGNILLAIGMAAMCSRVGAVVLIFLMILFNYRLIFREEAELSAARGENYAAFLQAVPRLWPSLTPRVPAAGGRPSWSSGFKVESWYWGFALSIWAFAITLKTLPFFIIMCASVALFLFVSSSTQKNNPSPPSSLAPS
jgi:protein-S-isoprenylcysteine O-methyltransferase Ste14